MPSPLVVVVAWLITALCCPSWAVSAVQVHELDDLSFDRLVNGSQPWMVDVYAPWCTHCQALAPVWEELAEVVARRGILLGKINGPANIGLMRRLRVTHFPQCFHFFGSETREVPTQLRSLPALTKFALEEWTSQPARTGCKSPVSLCGRTLGLFSKVAPGVKKLYLWLHQEQGYSHVSICLAALSIPMSLGLLLICALDHYWTAQPRRPHYD